MNLEQLQPYLPTNALFFIDKWIKPYPLTLKITRNRQTKLGDYRKLSHQNRHLITINGDLNPDAFFFVLTHEIAHMIVYARYNYNEVLPHGKEWKKAFASLLIDSISIYPSDKQMYIANHAKSPKASVGADYNIAKYIIDYSDESENFLEDLKTGDTFKIGQKVFRKGEKQKLRYICYEYLTDRKYLISATALVKKLKLL